MLLADCRSSHVDGPAQSSSDAGTTNAQEALSKMQIQALGMLSQAERPSQAASIRQSNMHMLFKVIAQALPDAARASKALLSRHIACGLR